jgi:hypothetical protein
VTNPPTAYILPLKSAANPNSLSPVGIEAFVSQQGSSKELRQLLAIMGNGVNAKKIIYKKITQIIA